MLASTVVTMSFILLAIAHSLLGEARVIRPLLAADWEIGISRLIADRLLRFVWHALSLGWIGIAIIFADLPISAAVFVAAGIPGLVLLTRLRGHLAWPLFLLAATAAAVQDGLVGTMALRVTAIVAVGTLVGAGLVHIYWAAGGRWMADRVFPMRSDGQAVGKPPPLLTLVVAGALFGFAALVVLASAGSTRGLVQPLVITGVVVFTIRAIGDGRFVGFSKTVRGTLFSAADDRYFTPIVVLIAFGATASLLL